jgi:hypothetical protein
MGPYHAFICVIVLYLFLFYTCAPCIPVVNLHLCLYTKIKGVLIYFNNIYNIYRSTSYNPSYKQCTEHLVVG